METQKIYAMKNTSVLQINKRRQNQILKELTDGPLKPVISIFNKSQKAQKNPKYLQF